MELNARLEAFMEEHILPPGARLERMVPGPEQSLADAALV